MWAMKVVIASTLWPMLVCVPGSCLRFGGEPRHPRGSPWALFQRSHVGKHLYRLLFFPPSIQESHLSSPANQKPSLHTYIALSCSTRWQSALTNCNHRLNHIRISSCEKRLLSSSWLHNVGVNKGIWQSVGCKWGQLRGHWWTFAKTSGNDMTLNLNSLDEGKNVRKGLTIDTQQTFSVARTWKIHQSPPYKDVNPMQGWLSRTWCSSGTAMLGNSSCFETSHWILATKPPLLPENNLWQLWRFHSSSWIHPGFLSMLWWTAMHKSMTIIRCFLLGRRRHHKCVMSYLP